MVFQQMTGQSFRGRWGGSVRRVGQSLKPAMSVGAPELGMLAQVPEFWDLYHPIPCSIFDAILVRRYGKPMENVPCFARKMISYTFWWVFHVYVHLLEAIKIVLASIVSKMDRMCTKFHCMPLTCRLRMLGAKKQYNLLG